MKKYKNLICFAVIVIVVTVVLTACKVNDNETSVEETTRTTAIEETTAKFKILVEEPTAVETTAEEPYKSNEEIANEVIRGEWFTGEERREALLEAGYDPAAVQEIVNDKFAELTKVVETTKAVETTATNENGMTYVGTYRMTAYCANCNNGTTALGTPPVVGRTIAFNNLPLGTKVYIKGWGYYVVEDRGGMSGIDLYVDNCKGFQNPYVELYVVG